MTVELAVVFSTVGTELCPVKPYGGDRVVGEDPDSNTSCPAPLAKDVLSSSDNYSFGVLYQLSSIADGGFTAMLDVDGVQNHDSVIPSEYATTPAQLFSESLVSVKGTAVNCGKIELEFELQNVGAVAKQVGVAFGAPLSSYALGTLHASALQGRGGLRGARFESSGLYMRVADGEPEFSTVFLGT
jgi:hypothetical protein